LVHLPKHGYRGMRIGLSRTRLGGKLAQFPGGPLPNQNLVKVG
jgi:hypothetical protein